VWNCNIFDQMEQATPGIDRKEKCKNYIEKHDQYWEVPCLEDKRADISRFLDEAVSGTLSPYYLEYDGLQYILTPAASNEIAVFVGGSHADRMESILKSVDYRIIYEGGFSLNEVVLFKTISNPYKPSGQKNEALLLYTTENSHIIDLLLQETLVDVPNLEQRQIFLEGVYEQMQVYKTVLQSYEHSLPLSVEDQKKVLVELAQMKQKTWELREIIARMAPTNGLTMRWLHRAFAAVQDMGFLMDVLEYTFQGDVGTTEAWMHEQEKSKRKSKEGDEYEDENPRKKTRGL